MKLIVDASVVIKWYVAEIDTAAARQLYVDERFLFCVPGHAFGEIGNALATYVRRGLLPRSQIPHIGRQLNDRITSYPIERPIPPAIEIALEIGSTVYDALYVALAAELDSVVATADMRLVEAASRSSWRDRVNLFTHLTGS